MCRGGRGAPPPGRDFIMIQQFNSVYIQYKLNNCKQSLNSLITWLFNLSWPEGSDTLKHNLTLVLNRRWNDDVSLSRLSLGEGKAVTDSISWQECAAEKLYYVTFSQGSFAEMKSFFVYLHHMNAFFKYGNLYTWTIFLSIQQAFLTRLWFLQKVENLKQTVSP